MKIAYNNFGLMRPGVAPHLLQNGEAQQAYNCKITKYDLRSFFSPSQIESTAVSSPKTLMQYQENSNTHFVVSSSVLHGVKSPVANEQYERLWFTGENEMRFFANDNISGGGFDPTSDYLKAGIPAPTTAPTVARVGSAGSEYRQYLYIFVNRYSDPGSYSPLSNAIVDYDSGRVTVTGIESAPSDRGIDRIWLYRINTTGKNEAEYQFVLEATYFNTSTSYDVGDFVVYSGALYECTTSHPAGAWNGSNFTAGEQVANNQLGTVFEYGDYTPPPDGLKGLCLHPSGAAVGYVGNAVYFSVPNRLHAWPLDYRKSQPYEVRGIAIVGSNVFVLRDGPPIRYYGQHPDSMAPYHYGDWLPLPDGAQRTVATWKDEVYYRTTGGMAKLNTSVAVLITAEQPGLVPIIDSATWEDDFSPLHGCFYKDLYFGHGAANSFYIDFGRRGCSWITKNAIASMVSQIDGAMYMIVDEAGTNYIEKWEGDTQNCLQYTWRGRLEMLDYETNIAYGLITLDPAFYDDVVGSIDLASLNATIFAGYLEGDLRGDNELRGDILLRGDNLYDLGGFSISPSVNIKIIGDEDARDNREVSEKRALFSFASGWMASRLALELNGYVPVLRAAVAESPEEVLYG